VRQRQWAAILGGMALAPLPALSQAAVYLSEDQAQALLFPGMHMRLEDRALSPAETAAIEKASGQSWRHSRLRVWWGASGEALFIDQVLGKHDLITYALAVTAPGVVKGLEILEYREHYGGQVRRPDWRSNFKGKSLSSPLAIGQDIPNISGATLSSSHLTEGVRRLLTAYAILGKNHG
jgi:hypothetical protein